MLESYESCVLANLEESERERGRGRGGGIRSVIRRTRETKGGKKVNVNIDIKVLELYHVSVIS